MPEPNRPRLDFVPILVLFAVVATFCAGIWLFPVLQKYIQRQDCIAIGRNDCD